MSAEHENQAAEGAAPAGPQLRIRHLDGRKEPMTQEQLTSLIQEFAAGLDDLDTDMVSDRVYGGMYDGIPALELDKLLVQVPAALTSEDPEYSRLAARFLDKVILDEVQRQGILDFASCIAHGHKLGIISDVTAKFVADNADALNPAIDPRRADLFHYFGLRTLYDRYLLRHPKTRDVFETPQYFFLRVACGLAHTPEEAIELYRLLSSLEYLTSSPTLFNSGTQHSQMSSCYLLDSPGDSLEGIYERYSDIAKLSKFAGGIGVAWHRIRARGSLIQGTNGRSNGIIPWLKTLDSSVAAVNQGGKRKGACCVYLEPWHPDILEFLELRENTGDEARRTYNLNLAHWIPDLFMQRVLSDEMWSLFDPKEFPELVDTYGDEFERIYEKAESEGRYMRQVKARDLYARMMRTLAQTGNGWMTFKDHCNSKSNQTGKPGNVVHSSNLCTEIVEVTSQGETAVCNLGSINLGRFVEYGEFNFEKLRDRVKTAVKYLDRVIDINYYPTPEAADSNKRWRPVGLGVMGLQDVFFLKRMPFDSPEAVRLSARIQEEIYFAALDASCEMAQKDGPHASFPETRAAQGVLQFDLWGVRPDRGARGGGQLTLFGGSSEQSEDRWDALKARIKRHGLRNSLLIAIAPTATIASIANCYECIEPQVSNLFKRETLSGEFLQVNRYLVADLKELGLWNARIRELIKSGEGSIQHIDELPEEVRKLYRTAWELPQKALIDMAAARSPYIDQSASLNLFMATPTIGKLSSMYAYAWRKGLKTTYYLRSRPATRITRTGTSPTAAAAAPAPNPNIPAPAVVDSRFTPEQLACSLENPGSCEACS